MRPRGHQRGAGAIPSAVVLEGLFCPKAEEIGWPGLGNWTVQFGGHHELVLAFVLVSAFTSRTPLPSAEELLLGPVLP
jgi:hypothetical protein